MKLSLAISPCPNDTFSFFHFIEKYTNEKLTIPSNRGRQQEYSFEFHFADVEQLNSWAIHEKCMSITKLSFAAFLKVSDHYDLLPVGAALGYSCGPLLLAQTQNLQFDKKITIITPGENTTATLLLIAYLKSKSVTLENINFVHSKYDLVIPALLESRCDAGLIIHEERFLYKEKNLNCIQDLGQWWEEKTGFPIPLGCLAIDKQLPLMLKQKIVKEIYNSIKNAKANPTNSQSFVQHHAQSIENDVLLRHIDLYVNDYSLALDEKAIAAIQYLARLNKKELRLAYLSDLQR